MKNKIPTLFTIGYILYSMCRIYNNQIWRNSHLLMATNYIICAAQMGTWENFEVHKNPNGVQLFLVTMTFWISLSTPNSALSHKRKRNLEAKIIKFILYFFPKKLKFVTYFPKENKCFVYTNIQKHCDRRHLTLKNSREICFMTKQ